MAKKTTLTHDQASELEELISDYCTPERCFGNPKRDMQDLLRQVGCPKDVTAALIMKADGLVEDIRLAEQECTRGNCESVAEGFKNLDEYLTKRFKVVNLPGRMKEYRWMVDNS